MLAKRLAEQGHRVLLVDCDFNLSNITVKLGLPLDDRLYSLYRGEKKFNDILHRWGNLHILSSSNGSLDVYENEVGFEYLVIDIINSQERNYDYIVLDCPAGVAKASLNLSAYSDLRMVVVTPDKSSVTDSYSLIKILNKSFGVKNAGLFFNQISSERQYNRLRTSFSQTIEKFLNCHAEVFGYLKYIEGPTDHFDQKMLNFADLELSTGIDKVVEFLVEKEGGNSVSSPSLAPHLMKAREGRLEQKVQSMA
jgi:flagellar biosynthesis protein FlhG